MSITKLPELIPYEVLQDLVARGIISNNVLDDDGTVDPLQLLRWRQIFIQHIVLKTWQDQEFRVRLFSNDPDIVKQAIKDASASAGAGGYEFRPDVNIRCVPDANAFWNGREWETESKITIEIPIPVSPDPDNFDPTDPAVAPTQQQLDAQAELENVLTKSLGILGAGPC